MILGDLGVSRRTAPSMRSYLQGFSRFGGTWYQQVIFPAAINTELRKSTVQHLTVNWKFNVLEMALKTFHIFQGLSRTPLLFIPRYLTSIIFGNIFQKRNLENRKSENPKTQVH